MSVRINDDIMKQLVTEGTRAAHIPDTIRRNTRALLRSKTETWSGKKLLPFLRYAPALAPIVLLVVLLPVLAWSVSLIVNRNIKPASLIVVSQKGGTLTNTQGPLEFGYAVKENDVILTKKDEQVSLQQEDFLGLHLFSQSRLIIERFSLFSGIREFTLVQGAIYINKDSHRKRERSFSINIEDYIFELIGTRVYLSVDSNVTITAICYDGIVRVTQKNNKEEQILCTLYTQEKITINSDGEWQKLPYTEWSNNERILDEELSMVVPLTKYFKEIPLATEHVNLVNDIEESGETIINQENNNMPGKPEPAPEESGKGEPFVTIETAGDILPEIDHDNKVSFFSHATGAAGVYLINNHDLYLLTQNGLNTLTPFSEKPTFYMKPVYMDNLLCLVSIDSIFILDSRNRQIVQTIPLGKLGNISDNYYPVYKDGILYVPVQNHGYMTINSGQADFSLKLLYQEKFPFAPVVTKETLYIGSFFDNYIGAVDYKGNLLWKRKFKGKSYSNFVIRDNDIFLYVLCDTSPQLLRIDSDGNETGRWDLPSELLSDFIISETMLYGISKNGTLFAFDIKENTVTSITKIFSRKLPTLLIRNILPLVFENLLYIGTEKGMLCIYDIKKKNMDSELILNESESFFTSPFVFNKSIYCIANSGTIYKYTKTLQ